MTKAAAAGQKFPKGNESRGMGKYLNGTGLKATTVHCVWFYLCRQFADIVPCAPPHHDQTPVFLLNLQYCVSDCLWKGPSFLKLIGYPNSFSSSILLHGVTQLASLAVSSGPIPSSSFLLHCSRLGPYRVTLAPLELVSHLASLPLCLPVDNLNCHQVFLVNNNGDHTNPLKISRDISVQTKLLFLSFKILHDLGPSYFLT